LAETFAASRANYVLSQIPLNLTVTTGLSQSNGYYVTASPTVTLNGQKTVDGVKDGTMLKHRLLLEEPSTVPEMMAIAENDPEGLRRANRRAARRTAVLSAAPWMPVAWC
jgi:hypothetical protein